MQNRNQNLTGAQISAMVQEEDLEELQNLKSDLQKKVDEAHQNGRVYMMQQYTLILAKVTAEVRKVRDRFDREILAGNRRAHKELKLNNRGEDEA
jgi:hypothetical protein